MDKKVTGIVGYITWIGLVVALLAGDKEGAKFHLNQSLVLWVAELVLVVIARVAGFIPVVGLIVSLIVGVLQIVLFVFWIMGLIHAIKEEETPLPIIGGIQILK
ncbi:MAG: hypothetical protein K2O97_12440 [Acetatifactor sp.]|nr:hypothetical protein [Acetatifactor sp.]